MLKTLTGATIFDSQHFFENHGIILSGENIQAIMPLSELPENIERVELAHGIVAPGFIDLQVNGGGGKLFNNKPCLETLKYMLDGHRQKGTTSMMPTFISDNPSSYSCAVEAVHEAFDKSYKGILGLHLEGPFLVESRRGTHSASYIRKASSSDIQWLLEKQRKSGKACLVVTLAPEQVTPSDIQQLVDAGIIVCVGHSDAEYEKVEIALAAGVSGFTHLYNAMRPLQGRDPGVVGAALSDPNSWCGIIADGHHVHPIAIKVAIAAKPPGKVFLVSDAMATVGSEDHSFTLYTEEISENNGCLINAQGRLAGSAIGLIDAVKFCVEHVNLAVDEALRMASLYPAQFIAKDNCLGRIKNGYRADLVHFNQDYNVLNTWVAGEHKPHK
ncbi:N-acetylglucosamine-6-phosphate deacetylase [Agarilytica rhodophyticola]|uniref:N-acetylglucosamine-6-phosphate deacetylase n=1 Tax=Agarilytica rhodophyticola TaxID=1737490 RepID=UPI000B344519|nr:N-acetylglucosamine-6-phosphate deacetylase [Agarilytica rhodophyticola]